MRLTGNCSRDKTLCHAARTVAALFLIRYNFLKMTEILLLLLIFLFVIAATVLFIVVYYWGPKGPPRA